MDAVKNTQRPIEDGGLGHLPGIGLCFDCGRKRRFTWEVESTGQRLCRVHIQDRIRRATWPNPPTMG